MSEQAKCVVTRQPTCCSVWWVACCVFSSRGAAYALLKSRAAALAGKRSRSKQASFAATCRVQACWVHSRAFLTAARSWQQLCCSQQLALYLS